MKFGDDWTDHCLVRRSPVESDRSEVDKETSKLLDWDQGRDPVGVRGGMGRDRIMDGDGSELGTE